MLNCTCESQISRVVKKNIANQGVVKKQILDMTATVEILEPRNGRGYAKDEKLSVVDGRGSHISWGAAMKRLQNAAEKGKLGVVLDAMDVIWDTKGALIAKW